MFAAYASDVRCCSGPLVSITSLCVFTACRSEVSFGNHSFRDQEHQKKSLEEENFKLKLRIYMLEERLQRQDSNEGSSKAMAELKVDTPLFSFVAVQVGASVCLGSC